MLSNIWTYVTSFSIIPLLLMGLLGLILGWLLFRGNKQEGDLSIEGEGALRAEADSLRARVQELEGQVSTRDTEVSGLKGKLAAAAAGAVGGAAATAVAGAGDDDETYALEWRNRYLAARVKYLEGRLAEAPKSKAKAKPAAKKKAPAKKAVAKKAPAKKVVAKKAAAKKAPAKKAPAKKAPAKKAVAKTALAPKKTAAKKKAAPKKPAAKKAAPKKTKAELDFDKYYTNVKKFDSKAKRSVVEEIVKYCGISLRSRDSSLVACSDPSEVETVANGFVTKKLEMTSGQLDLVKDVCQQMKGQRFKNRVTFYYLAAKKAKKLSVFGG